MKAVGYKKSLAIEAADANAMAGAYSRLSEVIAGYGGFDGIDGEFRQLPT